MSKFVCLTCGGIAFESPRCSSGHGAMVLWPTPSEIEMRHALLDVITNCASHGRDSAHHALQRARQALMASHVAAWKDLERRSVLRVLGGNGARTYVASLVGDTWSAAFADDVEYGDRGIVGGGFLDRAEAKSACERHAQKTNEAK